MALDFRTLVFITSLSWLGMGAAMLALYLGHRQERGLKTLAIAMLLSSIAPLLYALYDDVPLIISPVAGNVLLLLGNVLILQGVRTFYGRTIRLFPYLAAVALALVGTLLTTFVWPHFSYRVAIFTAVYVPVGYCIAAEFLRPDPRFAALESWPFPRWLTGGLFLLNTTYVLVRGLYQFYIGSSASNIHAPNLLHSALAVFGLIVGIGWPFGFALLTSQKLQRRLNRLAELDHLTEALNRRAFEQQAEAELGRVQRHDKGPLALLLFDLDHFKEVNDTYGHQCGDEVLRQVAATVQAVLRPYDRLGRVGGEEFAVLLPYTAAREAMAVAERLADCIRRQEVSFQRHRITITVSIGVAVFPEHGQTFQELYREADARLYEAKHRGRDQVVCASSLLPGTTAVDTD